MRMRSTLRRWNRSARKRLARTSCRRSPVRRGDDARAHHALLRLADALVFSVFEHSQELRLQLKRKLANFIEEQGAVGRLLEIAGLGRSGRP